MLKRAVNVIGLILVVASASARAADADEQAYLALMSLLNAQTELVTKTKVNADYVPGSLTVLRGNELRRYGVRTVKDALNMTPSVEVQLNHLGQNILVMRGMGTPFSGGTVKLMLDEVNLVSSSAGYSEGILNMPIEQVERIEIIRGASSVLHGDFAYAGVVNVVSRQANSFGVGVGSFGYRHLNAAQVLKSASQEATLSLSFAQWQRDKTGRRVEGDVLTQFDSIQNLGGVLSAKSQAPLDINDRRFYRSFLFNLKHHETEFYGQAQEYKTGDYFGIIEFLPKETQDYNQTSQDFALGVRQEQRFTPQLRADWHIGLQQRSYDLKTLYTSEDISFMQAADPSDPTDPNYDSHIYAFERPVQNYVQEQVVNVSGHLTFDLNPQHRLLLGAEFERHYIAEAYAKGFPSDDVAEPDKGNRHAKLASKGDARNVLAIYAQEEWRPNENFTLTTGLRAQKTQIDYQDISEGGVSRPFSELEQLFLTPKIAAVYRLNPQHIIKAQYSQSMITPPIHQVIDVGTNPSDKPYTAQTDHYELGYIFQGDRHVQRLTAFYSEYASLPRGTVYYNYFSGEYAGFDGFSSAQTRGVEWDSEFSIASTLNGFASASWIEAKDNNNNIALVGSTDRMANIGLNYLPSSDWRVALWVNYFGERYREPYDSRQNLPAYMLTHLTVSYLGAVKGLAIRLGVENLADVDYRYPSPVNGTLTTLNSGEGTAAYQDDYPGFGRQVWAKLQYEF